MINLNLIRNSKSPLYQQIITQIIESIESGQLENMDILPPSRLLAEMYNLNRSTVSKAYQELWGLGYIESRPGSYSRIRRRKPVVRKVGDRNSIINWKNISENKINAKLKCITRKESKFDFRSISPDPNIVPVEKVRLCLNQVMKNENLLGYSDPKGYEPLREFIAEHLIKHSIESNIDEVFISNGSQNALDLLCKFFMKDNWSVIVEKPTYSIIIPLLKQYGANIIDVEYNEDGLDLNELEAKVDKHSPSFIYIMSNFQNPTGLTSSHKNREGLLSICEKRKIPIIEDGFTEDLRGMILPVKSMDKSSIVIYIGTFSKLLFPGLRIGWISAPAELINQLSQLQYISNISGNLPVQAATNLFCRKGYHNFYINRTQSIYKKRMKEALETLKKFFPMHIGKFTQPKGGYIIWITIFGKEYSETELLDRFKDRDIYLLAGSNYFASRSKHIHFRLSISQVSVSEINEGIKTLCNLLIKLYKG